MNDDKTMCSVVVVAVADDDDKLTLFHPPSHSQTSGQFGQEPTKKKEREREIERGMNTTVDPERGFYYVTEHERCQCTNVKAKMRERERERPRGLVRSVHDEHCRTTDTVSHVEHVRGPLVVGMADELECHQQAKMRPYENVCIGQKCVYVNVCTECVSE